MTVEADLYNTVKTLVSNRVYPDVAPHQTALPYITYQQVGGDTVSFLERSMPSKKNGSFQVNVWAATRAEAAALILSVESAIVTSALFQASAEMAPIAAYDEDQIVYGYLQHFNIWSDR
jgi:hypothetical protein